MIDWIERQVRRFQNRVIADSIREKGVIYGKNYGVSIPQLKLIASQLEPDKVLAEQLWKKDVRELKILSTMLYPVEKLTMEYADRWGSSIAKQELREQACINLFQNAPFADKLVQRWIEDSKDDVRTTGYWLFARLCISKSDLVTNELFSGLVPVVKEDIEANSFLLRRAAYNVLKFYGRTAKERAKSVLDAVAFSEILREELYQDLSF